MQLVGLFYQMFLKVYVCLYVSVHSEYVCVCLSVCLWRLEEDVRSLGVGVTSGCELSDIGAKN